MSTNTDLAARAARTATGAALRRAALQGLLLALPVSVAGAVLARLPHPDLPGLARPLTYVVQPLVHAWRHDLDLSLLGYVALQAALLTALAARLATDLGRRAAFGIATSAVPSTDEARAFCRRRWGSMLRARWTMALGLILPLVLALVALGWTAGATSASGRVLGALVALPFVLLFFVVLGLRVVAGYVPAADIAVDDVGAKAALGNALSHAVAAPGSTLGTRLWFFGRALISVAWRGIAGVGVGVGLYFGLRLLVGTGAMTRALAVLEAGGVPADASRLGLGAGDPVLALVLAAGLAILLLAWLTDASARLATARVAAYLALRHEHEGVAVDVLGPRPPGTAHEDADAAGFVEVARIR